MSPSRRDVALEKRCQPHAFMCTYPLIGTTKNQNGKCAGVSCGQQRGDSWFDDAVPNLFRCHLGKDVQGVHRASQSAGASQRRVQEKEGASSKGKITQVLGRTTSKNSPPESQVCDWFPKDTKTSTRKPSTHGRAIGE